MIKNQKKHGFTILEMLLMTVIISVSLSAIIISLNNGMSFMQKTREKTIAINLAREGIEAMYQMRDTNRYRRAWQKESCRLKANPLIDEPDEWCEDDTRMWSWNYILMTTTTWGQQYFLVTWGNLPELNLSNGITGNLAFSLCKSENGIRSECKGEEPVSSEGKYFRAIRWIWLFDKTKETEWGEYMPCTKWLDPDTVCNTNTAKEYRFCSKVAYIGQGKWEVELCGILTNFQKK